MYLQDWQRFFSKFPRALSSLPAMFASLLFNRNACQNRRTRLSGRIFFTESQQTRTLAAISTIFGTNMTRINAGRIFSVNFHRVPKINESEKWWTCFSGQKLSNTSPQTHELPYYRPLLEEAGPELGLLASTPT